MTKEALSPIKSPFFLRSNNDELERAQARAERAAAVRRKATALNFTAGYEEESCLGKEQILELFNNCVKLATENKINQKNTWELNLIDYLYEIVRVDDDENGTETNFQKASCTLEAGVKIYSVRVDSVHSEAYKVLAGITRVGREDEHDHVAGDSNISDGQEESKVQKNQQRKLSPLSTLESSFATINVKKFDVAFVVDPLYQQTSAQFDEGGAKGLLLNNLGVYSKCRFLFDSLEVPGKCNTATQSNGSTTIDLLFAKECIEPMVSGIISASEISPSLSAIVNAFDKNNRRPSEVYSSEQVDTNPCDNDAFHFDRDDEANGVAEGAYDHDECFPSKQDFSDLADEPSNFHDDIEDEDDYLILGLGFSTKQNEWAGPTHWKYRKVKDLENPRTEKGPPKAKNMRNKKENPDLEFSNSVNADISHIFAPPKNHTSLLLPANRASCNTRLPEDCHYEPENLVKLFLLPNVLCLGRRGRKRTDETSEHTNGYGQTASWDEEDGYGDTYDDGHDAYSDNEESSTLVSQPRQVNKIEVKYDKTSKQVDVHALKETLWDHLQKLHETPVQEEISEETISFKKVLASFSDGGMAEVTNDHISPHLCFICLLHLANEHSLRIHGCPSLDDLTILL